MYIALIATYRNVKLELLYRVLLSYLRTFHIAITIFQPCSCSSVLFSLYLLIVTHSVVDVRAERPLCFRVVRLSVRLYFWILVLMQER